MIAAEPTAVVEAVAEPVATTDIEIAKPVAASAESVAEELLLADGADPVSPVVAEEPIAEISIPADPVAEQDEDLELLNVSDAVLVGDLSTIEPKRDADAPASDVSAEVCDIDALRPDPDAPHAEKPAEVEENAVVSDVADTTADTSADTLTPAEAESTTAVADPVTSVESSVDENVVPWTSVPAADAAFAELEAASDATPETTPHATLDADFAGETIREGTPTADWFTAPPPGPINDQPAAEDIAAAAEFRTPDLGDFAEPSPIIETDLVRLSEDHDDDGADDATALAVDLGLVLDDDGLPSEVLPAAPVSPVDVDVSTGRPTGSVDLSHLGPTADAPYRNYMPNGMGAGTVGGRAGAGDEVTVEDLFEADSVEVRADSSAESPDDTHYDVTPPTLAEAPDEFETPPAPEAPKPAGPSTDDDHRLSAPSGGSLADLMPSGPPLLGGSFMALPPMPAPMPSIPANRGRPRRVGFGGERQTNRGAPFAAERTIGGASSIDDDDDLGNSSALLKGPSVDAFSATPAGRSPGSIGSSDVHEAVPAEALLAPTDRYRPRGTIRPVLPSVSAEPASAFGSSVASSVTVPVPMPQVGPSEEELADRAKKHKRRVRRIIACMIGMIVLIGGAAWGVYTYMPLRSKVDATINFDGLDRLSPTAVAQFRIRQNDALVSEPVRQDAILSKPAGVPDGFLSDRTQTLKAIDADPAVRWPDEQKKSMRLRVHSTDTENDVIRLRALAEAFAKTGEVDRRSIEDSQTKKRMIETEIARRRDERQSLNDQLQALEQAQTARKPGKDTSALNAEFFAAEPALTSIKSRRQELEATVDRLKKPAPAPPPGPAIDPVAADADLAALTKQLNELQQSSRPAPIGAAARQALDETFKTLEKDLADAQKQRDNPVLNKYVEEASRLFKPFRDITEQLIRRQENNRSQLADLKAKMSDGLQSSTQERLDKDSELKKQHDALAIGTRKYNAAIASGFTEEAKLQELENRVLRVKIAEMEDKYKIEDPVFSPAIAQLQQIIDRMEADSRADRKAIDERLSALQGDFLKNSPDLATLPADQKKLAEAIQQKLNSVNEARQAYGAEAEKAQAEQAKAEAANAAATNELRLKIAARRQDVLAAVRAKQAEEDETTRKQRLTDAQAELATVRQQEQAAAHRLADAAAAIDASEKQKRIDAQSDTDLQAARAARQSADRKLGQANEDLATVQSKLAAMIVPDRNHIEVQSYYDKDSRPMFIAIAAAAIAGLMLIPILLDLLALAAETHPPQPARSLPVMDPGEGFEPVMADDRTDDRIERKALPEPASI